MSLRYVRFDAGDYATHVSRLRRLVVSDHGFLITCRLLPRRRILSESEFACWVKHLDLFFSCSTPAPPPRPLPRHVILSPPFGRRICISFFRRGRNADCRGRRGFSIARGVLECGREAAAFRPFGRRQPR